MQSLLQDMRSVRISHASYLRSFVKQIFSGISAETTCAISNRETYLTSSISHDIGRTEVRIVRISGWYFREPSKRIILKPKFPVWVFMSVALFVASARLPYPYHFYYVWTVLTGLVCLDVRCGWRDVYEQLSRRSSQQSRRLPRTMWPGGPQEQRYDEQQRPRCKL